MSGELTFDEAMRAIGALEPRGWRLGLDRMQEFVRLANLEQSLGKGTTSPKYLQVAGTNGKGTVTGMIQHALHAQGFKTGAFFSPFVYDPRERVQIGLEFLADEFWSQYAAELLEIGKQMESTPFDGPTEFELKTAVGLKAWLEHKCEWVALEVGLGGRLDATSVVTPAAGVIVSIGLDHLAILGDTESKIATEKAGIIKPKMPIIVGKMSAEALPSIEKKADEMEALVWRLGKEILISHNREETTVSTPGTTYPAFIAPNLGIHSAENAALSLATLEAGGAIRDILSAIKGITETKVPGRNEIRRFEKRTWLLDGAHNSASAESLSKLIKSRPEKRKILITGILQGHEPEHFYSEFQGVFERIIVAPIDFHRARNQEELAEEISKLLIKSKVTPSNSIKSCIESAIEVTEPGDLIVVTGSFYLVGEVGRMVASLTR